MAKQAINRTKNNQIVANTVEMATNPWTRFKGLMGRHSIPDGHSLWIEPCADIHSFFMKFEFDALYLDKNGIVLHIVEAMKPWRVSKWVKGTQSVLELNKGVIKASQTSLGDQIDLVDI